MREAVHWSVFERREKTGNYIPANVRHEEFWRSVYVDGTATDTDIVGRDEKFLEWWKNGGDYDAMLDILPEERLPEFKFHAAKLKGQAG